jgi:hypothetical protein
MPPQEPLEPPRRALGAETKRPLAWFRLMSIRPHPSFEALTLDLDLSLDSAINSARSITD